MTWCKTAFINNQAIQILSEEILQKNSLPFPTFLLLWRYVHTIVQIPIFNEMANGCTVTEFIEACARLIMSCMEPLVYIYICHSMPIRCCETLMLICFQKDENHKWCSQWPNGYSSWLLNPLAHEDWVRTRSWNWIGVSWRYVVVAEEGDHCVGSCQYVTIISPWLWENWMHS